MPADQPISTPSVAEPVGLKAFLALALSVLAHLGLFAVFVSVTPPGKLHRGAGAIDTRSSSPEMDVRLVLAEPEISPVSLSRTVPTVPPAAAVETPAMPLPSEKAPMRPARGAGEPMGAGEEQEAGPSRSGAVPGSSGSEAGTGRGPVPTISFFSVTSAASRVVFLLDHSASMGPSGGLAAAKREIHRTLDALSPATQFQIIAYNRLAEPLVLLGRTGMVTATPATNRAAWELIQDLEAEGGTDHGRALRRALTLNPDVIYWLTDGADLPDRLLRELEKANHGRTQIHVIELQSRPGGARSASLERLALQHQGVYRQVSFNQIRP